jgi:hypothetical protein
MKFFHHSQRGQLLILALSQVMGGGLRAGEPAPAESPARLAAPAPAIPAPPTIKSPVDFFRELLAMSATDRMRALSNRPPENRKLILAKVREYLSLKPDERELRLRATQLEWRLVPLMKIEPTNRLAQLSAIPEEDQKMIEARLQEWDQLPEAVRKELLARRETLRIYIQMTSPNGAVTNIPYGPRGKAIEDGLKVIQSMPVKDRQKLVNLFTHYFELSPGEQRKALRTLTPAEQQQIQNSLAKFKGLTPPQRAQCIRSFAEFDNMSPVERQQFLKNAERWIMMTPTERQRWRDLVEKTSLTPPMPPTPNLLAVPRPPPVPQRRSQPVVSTNVN